MNKRHMELGIAGLALGAVFGSLVGCSGYEAETRQLSSLDACAIALVPHANDAAADPVVAGLQAKINGAVSRNTEVYLERLGWVYVAQARTRFDPGYYGLAEQTALCMESKNPGSHAASLLRAHALHSQHRFGEAESLAKKLVQERGLSLDYAVYGDALMEQGRLEAAIDAYQSMLDTKPGPHAYSRAAHMRWLKGDLPGAIALMEQTAGASGSRDAESAAWAHERLAFYELQAGRVTRARVLLDKALELRPDYPPALLAKGRMLMAAGEFAQASSVLTKAVAANPLPDYQWALLEALQADGRASEASAVRAELMRRGPADDRRTFALFLASAGGSPETAVKLAESELQARQDVFTLDAYAWALRAAGRSDQAHLFSTRSLREGTRDARLHYHAGVIAREAGDWTTASRWLASATRMEHTLLPSERRHLQQEVAALQARASAPATFMEDRHEI